MKGHRVETAMDARDTTWTYEVVASKTNRRVETAVRRGVLEVSEVTRTGAVVRTAPFMASQGRPSDVVGALHPGEYAIGVRVILP
ncbi:hypothetical protein [Streptomyces sp. NPDC058579]|uniref:hypothetical protein n=1 Tax=Streptomyces sp. NPDC058579 TaxID=3346548 RepID=UPI003648B380